jgi:hypothetical protein
MESDWWWILMRRFVYAPDINAYVATDNGIIDLSQDVISGSVTRRVNAVSSAELVLQNPKRKYLKKGDPIIKPMDRIVIYLTRIYKPTLVFSGYIDRAPYDQLFPGPVKITASCTLKRLLHTYWDPGLPFVTRWLSQYGWMYDNATGTMLDPSRNLYNADFSGGLGHLLRAVMHDVGGWSIQNTDTEHNTVHVMKLPDTFIEKTRKMIKNQLQANENQEALIQNVIDNLLTKEGVFSGYAANSPTFEDNTRDNNPLPKNIANKTWGATIYGEAVTVGNGPGGKYRPMALDAANKYDLDPAIFFGLVRQESNWGHVDDVNSAGALGLTQVVPPKYGYSKEQLLGDAALQLDVGAHYLSDMYKQFQKWELALAAYNAGPGNVLKYGGIPPFKETQDYVPKVVGYADEERANMANAGKSGPKQGKVGDVKASNSGFFEDTSMRPGGAAQDQTGYTFKIKGNPYGDDNFIFRAIYDSNVPSDHIQIYVPGASNKGTPQAAAWTNHSVTLETSFGRDPFATATSLAPTVSVPNMTPAQMVGKGGVTGPAFNNSKPITKAVLAYIQKTFGPLTVTAGWVPANDPGPHASGGEHPMGLAWDIVPTEGWTENARPRMYALARWAGWFPGAGDGGGATSNASAQPHATPVEGNKVIRWVGWDGATNHGWGNHLHISVVGDAVAQDIPGIDPKDAAGFQAGNQAYGTTGVQVGQAELTQLAASTVFGIELGFPAVADVLESEALAGKRALANDVPLFEWIEFICKASGRNFQSTPTGDFLAYYPDYFNWANQVPYLIISPIETIDLSIDISDEELTTHVFTTADTYIDGQITILDKMASTVASVEETETFTSLVNVDEKFDPIKFLRRYGARPWQENRPEIKHSFLQFMYGWMVFLDKWSKQFYCSAEFTFLPELFPGTLVEFATKDLIMYVNEVTHNFDRTSGFTTSASLVSPSTRGGYNPSMVLAGKVK